MKEIVILLVTFLGICTRQAQGQPANSVTDSVQSSSPKKTGDSVAAKEKATVKLFPNPVKNKAELEVKGFEPGLVQLQVMDINGKKMRDDQRLLVSGNENIVLMFALTPGVYFILVKQKDKLVKKKMVVQ